MRIFTSTLHLTCQFFILFPLTFLAQWESKGPYGGVMTSLAISSSNIFVGTMHNGVFKSVDDGLSWTAANKGLKQIWITDLVSTSSAVFAGSNANGVFMSTDNGDNWVTVNNGLNDLHITSLFTTGSDLFAGTPAGVYFSSNNGLSWQQRNTGIPFSYDVYSWAMMSNTIYAGTYGQGLFMSNNNGTNWTQVAAGFPQPQPQGGGVYVYSMAASGNTIFAGTNVGIYLTTDAGNSWNYSGNLFMTNNQALSMAIISGTLFATTYGEGLSYSTDNAVSFIQANNGLQWYPQYPHYMRATDFIGSNSTVLAATWFGMYRSTNNGQLWQNANDGILATDIMGVASNGTVTYAGANWTGMYASVDKGSSWQRANNGLQSNHILAVATKDNYGFASVQNYKVYRSSDNGASWQYASNGLPADVYKFAVDSDRVLAITMAAKYTPTKLFQTTNNGSSWSEVPTTPVGGGMSAVAIKAPYFYLGTSQGTLLRSSNEGQGWGDISYYLPMASISAILPLDTVTFVGTSGKGIFMFLDNDSHMRTSINGLTNFYITDIVYQDGILFASTNGGGIFVSTNMGNSWMEFNGGLENMIVRDLATESGEVYAGTGAGVYNTDENAFKTISILAGVKDTQVNAEIAFYPVPAAGKIYMQGMNSSEISLSLFDLKGAVVRKWETLGQDNSIDLVGVRAGVYIMRLKTASGLSIRKVVIE